MGLSTLYDLTGAPQPLVVTIPPAKGQTGPSAPTGTVFNFTKSFEIGSGSARDISVCHGKRNHCRMESRREPDGCRDEEETVPLSRRTKAWR